MSQGSSLSEQQMQCLHLVLEMKTNKEIARELNISPSAVSQRLGSSYRKLRVFNRKDAAVAFAKLQGLAIPKWAAGDPVLLDFSNTTPDIAASRWTGIKTIQEQVIVIKTIAPIVMEGLGPLIHAVEQKRYNDPDALTALENAKELHDALAALIKQAESQFDAQSFNDRWFVLQQKAVSLLTNQRFFFAASPLLTMGTVTALELASNTEFSDQSVATVWAGLVAAKVFGPKM